jgi:uncharacterized protein (TIGR00251 family)
VSKSGKPRAEAGPPPAALIDVRVIPRSPRTRVDGMRGGAVLVRLAAPPVDGAANDALVAFLADHLDLPRRNIRIVSGDKSRDKRLAISGLSFEAIAEKMTRAAD